MFFLLYSKGAGWLPWFIWVKIIFGDRSSPKSICSWISKKLLSPYIICRDNALSHGYLRPWIHPLQRLRALERLCPNWQVSERGETLPFAGLFFKLAIWQKSLAWLTAKIQILSLWRALKLIQWSAFRRFCLWQEALKFAAMFTYPLNSASVLIIS